jgi:hypothetical protein
MREYVDGLYLIEQQNSLDEKYWLLQIESDGVQHRYALSETMYNHLKGLIDFYEEEDDKNVYPADLGLDYCTDEALDPAVIELVKILNKLPFFSTNESSGANGFTGRILITGVATDDCLMEQFIYYVENNLYHRNQEDSIPYIWWKKVYQIFDGIHDEWQKTSVDGLYYEWMFEVTPESKEQFNEVVKRFSVVVSNFVCNMGT